MYIRVGSRDSRLAVIQSEIIIEEIKKHYPDAECELVTMKTTGDKILDRTLDKVGGKGLFVKELDRALLAGEVDITVHSLKDVPMELAEGIRLTAFSERAAANDVLVLPEGKRELDRSLPIGCASRRRAVQLKALYPDYDIKPVRGNVLTRLAKLDRGEYGALVLAKAGLARLGLEGRISREFAPEEVLPAAGQGIIAVEAVREYEWLNAVSSKTAQLCAEAERAFVRRLNGGCSVPVAAYAEITEDRMVLTGMDGRSGTAEKKGISGKCAEAERLGILLAELFMEDKA